MLAYAVAYGASAIVFVVADFLWLSLMGPRLYRPAIGPLLAEAPKLAPAVVFYILYLAGVLALAIAPALKSGGWPRAALNGLILGVVAYATYDLTNQATLRVWATRLTLADMLWGGALTSLAATVGYVVSRRFA